MILLNLTIHKTESIIKTNTGGFRPYILASPYLEQEIEYY